MSTCMPICFWCTKETGKPIKIQTKKGEKVPKKAILNYEPCDNCKDMFSKGIHVIGVVDSKIVDGMPPILKDGDIELYPTGSFFVSSPEWTKEMLIKNNRENMIEDVLTQKVLMMPEEIVSKIIEESKDVPAVEINTGFMEDDN